MRCLPVLLCLVALAAGDSLPWEGAIVFEDPVRVDDASGLSGHPAIHPQTIMDDDWVLYTVWSDDRDNDSRFSVYFATSYDTARSWSTPNLVLSDSASDFYTFPWLAVDESNLYVVWQWWSGDSWRISLTRSSDRGATWDDPVPVPGIAVANTQHSGINFGPQPKLAVDSRSSPDTTFIYLMWADMATGQIRMKLARSADRGESFTDLGIVDKNPDNVNRNPYITVDEDGWVHCAWARGTSGNYQDPHPWIGYNRSTDRGVTFLDEDLIVNDDRDGVYRGNPSLTCHPQSGDILISWEDSRRASGNENPDIWYSRVRRDSLSAAPNQRVNWWGPDTTVRYENYKPVIRMDPQGVLVAAWHDDPEGDHTFGIHLAAYSDTTSRFSNSQSLINTFTGTSGGNFGNAFYPPSLFVCAAVDTADTVTTFYLVWQDFTEDATGGNIYSVRGRVYDIRGDLDVDNDSLDVTADTLRLRGGPPGTPPPPVFRGRLVLANTSLAYNPDPEDGPGFARVDSLRFSGSLAGPGGTLDSIRLLGLPASLDTGEVVVCTLAVTVPAGTRDGDYLGTITISGTDVGGAVIEEWFTALIRVLGDLDVDNDSLDVAADTCRLRAGPPGSERPPVARGRLVLANTSSAYNPDPEDGPSRSPIDSLDFSGTLEGPGGTLDSVQLLGLPASLDAGATVVCTLAVVVPPGTRDGDYTGVILVWGWDTVGAVIEERFNALVRVLGDLDVDNDSLDVRRDTMDLRCQPSGPVYSPYAKAVFMLANTSPAYNPDPEDGPSRSSITDLGFSSEVYGPTGRLDSIFILNLPEELAAGETRACTLALVLPVGWERGRYAGEVLVEGWDSLGFIIQERFGLRVNGPQPRLNLDSLRVAPIPFKPHRNPNHDAIHFQGLTDGARVTVYDASGHGVWTATEDGEGHVAWDAEVASGIYLYLVTSTDGEVKTGRLSVIR